ncbi:hypothetical protein [Marinitenerispora sediminis]|uniref:Uncharacterized protein n=1 Tax=Marinitenerispora sediminis TaxID=1931232 RepID=A0A368T908_9ACTN|nr:hypothetical protein [Marinitenerispora sediminis]RCV52640.1 hypothetical protein DEF28_12615 [Marinitenerispora sediminis]RCV60322.1 hypothetical protein DEF23_04805 [Marinitenerispora sediminis]RCV60575.1 hypothetical protein DEF24_06650 [Marinitenerispora sediminis]
MDALVNIAVFGIAGAVMMAALLGLLLVFAGHERARWARVLFGTLSVVVLVALPALAAADLLSTGAAPGFGRAFLTAFAVIVIIYAANVALLPLVTRRAAGPDRPAALPRLSAATLVGGLVVCALLGVVDAGIGSLLR